MNPFSVGVATIPIYHLAPSLDVLRPGVTGQLRAVLQSDLADLESNPRADSLLYYDYGDLIAARMPPDFPLLIAGDTCHHFLDLGRQVFELSRRHDLLVLLGGAHHAAFPLYFLPGRILRIDQHSDDESDPAADVPIGIHNGNYLRRAFEGELKSAEEVINWRVRLNVASPDWLTVPVSYTEAIQDYQADVFDMDLAALHYAYGPLSRYRQETDGYILMEEVLQLIQLNRPRVVGLFEYFPEYDMELAVSYLAADIVRGAMEVLMAGAPHFTLGAPSRGSR